MTDTSTPASTAPAPLHYSPKAIARVAHAHYAHRAAWTALKSVPVFTDGIDGVDAGLTDGNELAALTQTTIHMAVLRARLDGVYWDAIASVYGVTKQGAINRYAARVRQLQDALLLHWLRGRDDRDPSPDVVFLHPELAARDLDARVAELPAHRLPGAPLAIPARPVSRALRPPDGAEHGALLIDAAKALAVPERERELAPHADQLRPLRVGYGRRLKEFWWLARNHAIANSLLDRDEVDARRGSARAYLRRMQSGETPDLTAYATHERYIASYLKAAAAAAAAALNPAATN